jgi:hypothetical protein
MVADATSLNLNDLTGARHFAAGSPETGWAAF